MSTEANEGVLNILPANIAEIARVCETESTRYGLRGVHVEIKDGVYECAATDARRLLIVSGECLRRPIAVKRFIQETTTYKNKRIDDKPVNAIIAKRDLLRSSGLSEDQSKAFGFSQNCETVSIAIDQKRTIETQIINGKFPDYRAVLPTTEPAVRVTLNAKMLSEILTIAAKFQSTGRRPNQCTIDLEVRTAEDAIVIRLSPDSKGSQEFTALLMPLSSEGRK